jgi:hypothetical protein
MDLIRDHESSQFSKDSQILTNCTQQILMNPDLRTHKSGFASPILTDLGHGFNL